MSYYFSTQFKASFDDAVASVYEALKNQGFGVLTEIDVKATLNKKIGVEFTDYLILGACNPPFAYRALMAEDMIGTMLPCNVIVRRVDPETVEVAAIDPMASMQAVDNPELREIAEQIREKLKAVVDGLAVGVGS